MPTNTTTRDQQPELLELPIEQLFVDGVHELIFFGNVRVPHGPEGDGYARDFANRPKWLDARAAKFKQALLRPLDVSMRSNGKAAIVDGGGRWYMAQKNHIAKLWCRVHRGLSRKQEAELYVQLDKENYHQRQVDVFRAALSAGDPECSGIAECILPYEVEKGGKKVLDFPGLLGTIYNRGPGARTLKRTAVIIANTWGKDDGDEFGTGYKIAVADFGAVALFVEAAPSGWNEGILRDVLKRVPPTALRLAVSKQEKAVGKLTSAEKMLYAANVVLAKSFNKKSRDKVAKSDLASDLYDRIAEGGGAKIAFGTHLRIHDLRPARKRNGDE